jgi:holo-[acyl-carrier protein] synthase
MSAGPPPSAPPGTTELGIDICHIERIRKALEKHGRRFPLRILTPAEDAYVRDRPENLAGRWAAKEAVSKVLGLGVRGVGWTEIEIVRLPTGQPTVRLHERALRRAEQLGMERIAVSISHEREYAVAIAFGIRTAGGSYVFPVDVEARLDDRERQLLARMERLRALDREVRTVEAEAASEAALRREPREGRETDEGVDPQDGGMPNEGRAGM